MVARITVRPDLLAVEIEVSKDDLGGVEAVCLQPVWLVPTDSAHLPE